MPSPVTSPLLSLSRTLRRWCLARHPSPSRMWFTWGITSTDPESADLWLAEAERCGHPEAAFERALLWAEGGWGAGGREEALAHFRRACEQGHAEAAFQIAEAHRWGQGVPRDPPQALRYYRLAADRGCRPAMAWLAKAYAVGDGVESDEAEAAKWEARLAGAGPAERLPRKSAVLASPHGGGREIAPRDAEASFFSRMEGRGHGPLVQRIAGALFGLGLTALLALVLGVYVMLFLLAWTVSDFATAVWIGLVSALPFLGMMGAVAYLARLHRSGRAMPWSQRRLRKAADSGDPEACYRAGMLHLDGAAHWPKDTISARLWFQRAAQAGHSGAMVELARLLRWGAGGRKDLEAARAWLELSAAKGDPAARRELDGMPPPKAPTGEEPATCP